MFEFSRRKLSQLLEKSTSTSASFIHCQSSLSDKETCCSLLISDHVPFTKGLYDMIFLSKLIEKLRSSTFKNYWLLKDWKLFCGHFSFSNLTYPNSTTTKAYTERASLSWKAEHQNHTSEFVISILIRRYNITNKIMTRGK